MPTRRHATATERSDPSRAVVKKSAPVGPDCALVLSAASRPAMALSYWDLWFALVADADFEGSWERFVEHLRGQKAKGVGRDLAERKLSHLRDLQQRLQQAGVELGDILAQADRSPVALRRARQQVLEREPRASEWSDAMRHTPKQRRYAHALRGFWPYFPVSPASHANRLAAHFQTRGWFSENQSFGIARKLDTFVDGVATMINQGQYGQAQAMLRAFLTVVIELMERADDSFGCIGDSFRGGFAHYLAIPLDATGIDATVFFHDLLTLLIWEDYGLTYEQTDGYFAGLTPQEGALCIEYVQQQMEELTGDDLDYQYEEALTLLGQIVAEQNRFERFEELARHMGTRHWKRIVVLADRAVKKRKRQLAIAVFEAALSPGMHEGFLRRKYEQLKKGKWSPDPRR
jgi:hypothetical protein